MIFGRRERGGCRRLTSHFGSRVIRCRKSYRLTCPARHPLSSCAVVVRCRRPLSSSAVVVRCRRLLSSSAVVVRCRRLLSSSAVVVRFVTSRASIYPFLSTLSLSVVCSITTSLTFPLLFQTFSGQLYSSTDIH